MSIKCLFVSPINISKSTSPPPPLTLFPSARFPPHLILLRILHHSSLWLITIIKKEKIRNNNDDNNNKNTYTDTHIALSYQVVICLYSPPESVTCRQQGMSVLGHIGLLHESQRKEGLAQSTTDQGPPDCPLLLYVGARWSSNCGVFEEILANTPWASSGLYVSVDLSPEGVKSFKVESRYLTISAFITRIYIYMGKVVFSLLKRV